MKRFKCNSEGICPVCGSEDGLEYDGYEVEDNSLKYPWTCNSCGAAGDEFYDINFSEHYNVTDKDGREYAAEVDAVEELLEEFDRAAAEVEDDSELSAEQREGFSNGLGKARALAVDILQGAKKNG